jgi:hypothetical protein
LDTGELTASGLKTSVDSDMAHGHQDMDLFKLLNQNRSESSLRTFLVKLAQNHPGVYCPFCNLQFGMRKNKCQHIRDAACRVIKRHIRNLGISFEKKRLREILSDTTGESKRKLSVPDSDKERPTKILRETAEGSKRKLFSSESEQSSRECSEMKRKKTRNDEGDDAKELVPDTASTKLATDLRGK